MKVLDLRCCNGHAFEGWFGNEADFQAQLAQDRLQCPACGTLQVHKVLSAPRLNLGHAVAAQTDTEAGQQAGAHSRGVSMPAHPAADGAATAPADSPRFAHATGTFAAPVAPPSGLEAAWWHWARQAVSQADDVDARFAQEARRMHQGDAPERAIHGQSSVQETLELLEEGIAVLPLPVSVTDKLH